MSSLKRLPAYPDVPTVAESGVPGYELDNMYGLYAPAGVPAPILNGLNREVGQIMNSPEVKKRVVADGADIAPPNTAAEFRERFSKELEMWDQFIKKSGIKVEG